MILFVSRYSERMASARYRAHKWAERLRALGHETAIIHRRKHAFYEPTITDRIRFVGSVWFLSRRATTIVFQKHVPSRRMLSVLHGKRVVFDFDDRIYETAELADHHSRLGRFLTRADQIIVSTEYLRQDLVTHRSDIASRVVIIPTLFDPPRGRSVAALTRSNERVRIGWVGVSTGFKFLQAIEEDLSGVLGAFPQATFTVVSDRPYSPSTARFKVMNVKWALAKEVDYFRELDISLMPLDASPRARSKAGFKALQSLACGVPVIASAVGMNCDIIHHGENGFLAQKPEDFSRYLRLLIEDVDLRRRLAARAPETVKRFEFDRWQHDYLRALLGHFSDERNQSSANTSGNE